MRALTSILISFVLTLTACGGDTVSKQDTEQAKQAVASVESGDGKALAQTCQACHGADLLGNQALEAPTLRAQGREYIKRQLMNFRNGVRGAHPDDSHGAQMAAIAKSLPDEAAVDAVAGYLGNMSTKKPPATLKGDVKRGGDFYSNVCGSCHGPEAEGNKLLDAPALAGINDWYLFEQYEYFLEGKRGGHPDDRLGKQMQMMVRAIPDEKTAKDIAVYIDSLAK